MESKRDDENCFLSTPPLIRRYSGMVRKNQKTNALVVVLLLCMMDALGGAIRITKKNVLPRTVNHHVHAIPLHVL
jgi:hypothetical protein